MTGRRRWIARMTGLAGLSAASATGMLGGCRAGSTAGITGGFVGASHDRGHRLRWVEGGEPDRPPSTKALAPVPRPDPPGTRTVGVAIVGAGIAGLAAARALRAAGIDDYRLFELEDEAGGNSRGGNVMSLPCPWGAHYLPVPDTADRGVAADDLRALLREVGALVSGGTGRAAAVAHGATGAPGYTAATAAKAATAATAGQGAASAEQYDERMLCHAPQERLLVDGRWHGSLLPPVERDAVAADDYRRFAELIAAQRATGLYALPSDPSLAADPRLAALDRQTFAAWLDDHKLSSTPLRWYLDYCCRDDYGAGLDAVSAWAGLHYFASRHGFFAPSAPGASDYDDRTEVLTWPQGNAWLAERLAAPHRDRLQSASLVRRIERLDTRAGPAERGYALEVWRPDEPSQPVSSASSTGTGTATATPTGTGANTANGRTEHWRAACVVFAAPMFVALRVLHPLPPALHRIASRLQYANWQVANLYLPQPPAERPGVPRAWDNVIYGADLLGAGSLGYVDATHQSLASRPGATVFTCYQSGGATDRARRALLERSWQDSVEALLAQLEPAHADIRKRVTHVDIMRWGHGMLVPAPGLRSDPAFAALSAPAQRLVFAHSDLSGYSIFEEAFAHGMAAGRTAAAWLSGRGR